MAQERRPFEVLWRNATLSYCLLVAVAAWLMGTRGSSRAPASPLLRILFAPALLSSAMLTIYSGEVSNAWRHSRAKNPVIFWLVVAVELMVGFGILFTGLRDAWRSFSS
jgi:hypothetical protein